MSTPQPHRHLRIVELVGGRPPSGRRAVTAGVTLLATVVALGIALFQAITDLGLTHGLAVVIAAVAGVVPYALCLNDLQARIWHRGSRRTPPGWRCGS